MIKSMTGIGTVEVEEPIGRLSVEIRSLNHRFLDLNLRLPKLIAPFESRIAEIVRGKLSRGRVVVSVVFEPAQNSKPVPTINEEVAGLYLEIAEKLRGMFDLENGLTLRDLIQLPDVIQYQEETLEPEDIWSLAESAVNTALDRLTGMRLREGEEIARDLRKFTGRVEELVDEILERVPVHLEEYRSKVRRRIEEIMGDAALDENRLEQEVAYMANRLDISEECLRLRSHCRQFLETLERSEPVGRRLDFLLQEMLREANTISAKANDSTIIYSALSIKEAVESMKEQVQNVE